MDVAPGSFESDSAGGIRIDGGIANQGGKPHASTLDRKVKWKIYRSGYLVDSGRQPNAFALTGGA
jgi:hypothetical protein